MTTRLCVILISLFIFGNTPSFTQDLLKEVNPFIGTGGHGHTYPGAAAPFGMMQLSPDTRLDGWDGCSGYHYSDSIMFGFTHTHLSGTGCSDYGDILLMPFNGPITFNNGAKNYLEGYASTFSHDKEKATPGFYSVTLSKYDIDVALTATTRCGFHKYLFKKDEPHHVILDLAHRDKVLDAEITIINDSTIAGKRISSAWAKEQHLYFYIQCSPPFSSYQHSEPEKTEKLSGTDIKTILTFAADTKEVKIKIAISGVDAEGAKKNLLQEIPNWNFDQTLCATESLWRNELKKIEVEGGSSNDRINFYSALYHSFLNPNTYSDVDGRYRGRDLNIHQLVSSEQYTVFSLWDTFRATHPLFTIIQQKRTAEMIETMLRQYQQGGRLPVWELSANETDCMIGYHSIPVIVDAYMKGIKSFNTTLALEAMLHSANIDHAGLEAYRTFGYIPTSYEGESVSRTLEYAYDDWCIAIFAKEIGRDDVYNTFIERAQYWKNLYDKSTRFMRARVNADWFKPFDPKEVNFHYTEANAWQYNFFVPQDVNTMMTFMGGEDSFAAFLDEMFNESSETTGRKQSDITGLIGQYAHGNEPSHHMTYLYNYAKQPWKTQRYVREIMQTLYNNQPDGLCGNEDCGQMSSWLVLSSMGFYPVAPGSTEYSIGSPLFNKVTVNLENGNRFTINAKNQTTENHYVQEISLNDQPYRKAFISHEDIINGGTLTFTMGANPNKTWFTTFPHREITDNIIIPVPFVSEGSRSFHKSSKIALDCINSEAKIYYSMVTENDSTSFIHYKKPIKIKKTTTFYFYAQLGDKKSKMLHTTFYRIPDNITLELMSTYPNQYSAGGPNALIDGIHGGNSFKTGDWQGYMGQDLVATINMNKSKTVTDVSIGFIQDSRSWILMPENITVYCSDDNITFTEVTVKENTICPKEEKVTVVRHKIPVNKKTHYIKVVAKNPGKLPEWHLGAGHNSWIFCDEIEVHSK